MINRWFRNRAGEEKGAVLVMVSVAMVAMIGATALAVDIGRVTTNNRFLQASADVIALDAARTLTGQTAAQLSGNTGAVTVAVQNSATRNNVSFSQLTVALGTLSGTTFTTIATPIVNGVIQAVNPAWTSVPKAVKVTAAGTVNFAFQRGSKNTNRSATAVQEASAGFSIGSFLVGTTGAQDSVLSAVFGSAFHAQIVSYSGLANAFVPIKALGLNMPVTALTPTQLLSTSVTAKDLMLASAAALNDGSHTAAVTALNALAASVTATTNINLGDTLKLATGGEAAAANASVNVLQMLVAAAYVVDGTHAITIPAASVGIPNIAEVDISLNVISPAVSAFGPVGTSASTSQVSLTITPHLTISTSGNINTCGLAGTSLAALLGSALNLVGCLLGPVNKVLSVSLDADVPISLSVAGATGTLSAINCGANPSITITPQLQALSLTTNVDLTFTGTLLGVNLGNVLRIRGDGGAVAQSSPSPQTFLNPSQFGVARTVTSTPLGLAGLTSLNMSDATVLNVDLGGLLSPLTTILLSTVNSTLGALDTGLISPLNHLLGLGIGGADLVALPNSLTCTNLRLAA
jgi:uncharacterized membrane protein